MTALLGALAFGALVVMSGSGALGKENHPAITIGRMMVALGVWSLLSFYVALLLPAWCNWAPSALALGFGALGWRQLVARLRRQESMSSIRYAAGLAVSGLAVGLLPVLASYRPISRGTFSELQTAVLPLPIDNALPYLLAEGVRTGNYPRPISGDWLASDRPPLQSGVINLLDPVLLPFTTPERAAICASVLAQLSWVVGAALLASVLFGRSRIAASLVTAGLSGTVLINTIFTWPKLLAAGLFLAGWAILCLVPHGTETRAKLVLGGALVGLSLQAHGGGSFAVIGMIPVLPVLVGLGSVVQRVARSVVVALVAVAVQVPWMVWSRLGDPPGDRLLKYHLAGIQPVDPRSVPRAIADAYAAAGPGTTLSNKIDNLVELIHVAGTPLSPLLSLGDRSQARNSDFFGLLASTSWGLPAVIIGVGILVVRRVGSRPTAAPRAIRLTALWWAASVAAWCLLMFGPATTVVHQGALVFVLVPLLLAGGWAATVSPRAWLICTALQASAWVWIYRPGTSEAVDIAPVGATAAASGALVTAIALAYHLLRADPAPWVGGGRLPLNSLRVANAQGRPATRHARLEDI